MYYIYLDISLVIAKVLRLNNNSTFCRTKEHLAGRDRLSAGSGKNKYWLPEVN